MALENETKIAVVANRPHVADLADWEGFSPRNSVLGRRRWDRHLNQTLAFSVRGAAAGQAPGRIPLCAGGGTRAAATGGLASSEATGGIPELGVAGRPGDYVGNRAAS